MSEKVKSKTAQYFFKNPIIVNQKCDVCLAPFPTSTAKSDPLQTSNQTQLCPHTPITERGIAQQLWQHIDVCLYSAWTMMFLLNVRDALKPSITQKIPLKSHAGIVFVRVVLWTLPQRQCSNVQIRNAKATKCHPGDFLN